MEKNQINQDKCIGCQRCVAECFMHAIIVNKGKVSIIQGKCIGCGACQQMCPVNAIYTYECTAEDKY